jgi:hypothetical protein
MTTRTYPIGVGWKVSARYTNHRFRFVLVDCNGGVEYNTDVVWSFGDVTKTDDVFVTFPGLGIELYRRDFLAAATSAYARHTTRLACRAESVRLATPATIRV